MEHLGCADHCVDICEKISRRRDIKYIGIRLIDRNFHDNAGFFQNFIFHEFRIIDDGRCRQSHIVAGFSHIDGYTLHETRHNTHFRKDVTRCNCNLSRINTEWTEYGASPAFVTLVEIGQPFCKCFGIKILCTCKTAEQLALKCEIPFVDTPHQICSGGWKIIIIFRAQVAVTLFCAISAFSAGFKHDHQRAHRFAHMFQTAEGPELLFSFRNHWKADCFDLFFFGHMHRRFDHFALLLFNTLESRMIPCGVG